MIAHLTPWVLQPLSTLSDLASDIAWSRVGSFELFAEVYWWALSLCDHGRVGWKFGMSSIEYSIQWILDR
jgi:hypothetical protein